MTQTPTPINIASLARISQYDADDNWIVYVQRGSTGQYGRMTLRELLKSEYNNFEIHGNFWDNYANAMPRKANNTFFSGLHQYGFHPTYIPPFCKLILDFFTSGVEGYSNIQMVLGSILTGGQTYLHPGGSIVRSNLNYTIYETGSNGVFTNLFFGVKNTSATATTGYKCCAMRAQLRLQYNSR